MYYSDEIIEEIRTKSDIVDVVSRYVKIQKKGGSYFGLCPFHNEKSASFSVSPSKQMFYCFGCGAGGNVFTFIMKYENYTFSEAVKELADRAGVPLPEIEYSEEAKKAKSRREKLFEINKAAAAYFYFQLRAKQGQNGLAYFKERQLSDETMQKFGLGYSNMTSDDLVLYLKSKGYDDKTITDSGLGTFDERYGLRDKFWNRVMFPISDVNNRVIGFGGRVMGDAKPKYLNSQETEIFDKGRNLYGLNIAKSSKRPYFILCEGYMDVISMHQSGFDCAVASLGTAFTSGQATLLKRYGKDIILAYDSDGAGTKAALRALEILRGADLTGRVLNLSPYKDPDEFMKGLGKEKFEERIAEAENGFLFEIRILSEEFDQKDPESRTKFFKEVSRKICGFEEEVLRDSYVETIAPKYGIGTDVLQRMVKQTAATLGNVESAFRPKSGIQSKANSDENRKKPQKLLLTWLVDYPYVYPRIKKYISVEDFTEELYRMVAEKLFAQFEAGTVNPAAIISMFDDEAQQQEVGALFNTQIGEMESKTERETAFADILYAFKKNSFEYKSGQLGNDVSALTEAVKAKKDLEEIKNIHISLEE